MAWEDEEIVRMPDGPPRTIAVVFIEGGVWIPFSHANRQLVHAVLFDNGMIWDGENGWRDEEFRMSPADVKRLQELGVADK